MHDIRGPSGRDADLERFADGCSQHNCRLPNYSQNGLHHRENETTTAYEKVTLHNWALFRKKALIRKSLSAAMTPCGTPNRKLQLLCLRTTSLLDVFTSKASQHMKSKQQHQQCKDKNSRNNWLYQVPEILHMVSFGSRSSPYYVRLGLSQILAISIRETENELRPNDRIAALHKEC